MLAQTPTPTPPSFPLISLKSLLGIISSEKPALATLSKTAALTLLYPLPLPYFSS